MASATKIMAGLMNSTRMVSASLAAPFGGIRPTAMERQRGRLLRAPDHDAGTGGGDAPVAPAADVPTTDAAAPVAETPPAADAVKPASDVDGETSLLGGDAAKPEGEAAPEHVVPEKYELAVEGIELDATAIEAATPVFKELNLSNEQAGKLMPVAAQFRDQVATQTRDATLQELVDGHSKQKADWAAAAKADPEIGGGNLDQTLHLAGKALDHFGHPEGSDFRKLLTETGFGNHPDMVRIMRGVGELISEDGFPRSGAGQSKSDPLSELYPNNRRSK